MWMKSEVCPAQMVNKKKIGLRQEPHPTSGAGSGRTIAGFGQLSPVPPLMDGNFPSSNLSLVPPGRTDQNGTVVGFWISGFLGFWVSENLETDGNQPETRNFFLPFC
jgi:hypothetical protein